MEAIREFRGETRWLSNFEDAPIIYMDKYYPTTEHMYQALKAVDLKEQHEIIMAETPGKAKKLGAQCKMRGDWEEIKVKIMFHAVLLKFLQHKELAYKLIATGDAHLEEGNNWGDKFWGVCEGEGQNMLGKILMAVRNILVANKFAIISAS